VFGGGGVPSVFRLQSKGEKPTHTTRKTLANTDLFPYPDIKTKRQKQGKTGKLCNPQKQI
jgi:hypothetical protein